MVSRREVAAAAGVSVRTVSNVVNGFEHVAPTTRARVLEAIDRLSYRPSELARSLKRGHSGLVGLMLPQLDNPYFAEITRTLVQEGTRHGLTVVIDQTDGDRDLELAWIERANGALFDAMVLSPLSIGPEDVDALQPDIPVIFLGEDDYPMFDRVAVDSVAAARDATAHLLEGGRRRIAAFGAQTRGRGTSALRLEGYRAALDQAGIPQDEELVIHMDGYTRTLGHRAMHDLVDRGIEVDAVFCFADLLALGALRALHERGLRVPEDVAIVGFDDVEDGRFATPSISSISPDKDWLARTTFERLLRRLAGDRLEPETLAAPYRLVARESSAPA